jgi:hypothetical protein
VKPLHETQLRYAFQRSSRRSVTVEKIEQRSYGRMTAKLQLTDELSESQWLE